MISVSVVIAERSFSKLKLIKSYLSSTICHVICDLAVLSIERELRNIDFENLVNDFVEIKETKKIIFRIILHFVDFFFPK